MLNQRLGFVSFYQSYNVHDEIGTCATSFLNHIISFCMINIVILFGGHGILVLDAASTYLMPYEVMYVYLEGFNSTKLTFLFHVVADY